jgi:hypothetical protein
MEEGTSAFKILTGKPTRKRSLGKPGLDLKEICFNTRNWVHLAQDRDYWRALVNAALNLRVPYAIELFVYKNLIRMLHVIRALFLCNLTDLILR